MTILVGTAGWAIPKEVAPAFGQEGSALQRYATRFDAVEVNSSFHRPHRRTTWERWGASVPETFRFAVKIPKVISHERRLVDCAEPLAQFIGEVSGLGEGLSVLLLQLPPKLVFEVRAADAFFERLAAASDAAIVCEPRHPSWFEEAPEDLMRAWKIARVAADPAPAAPSAAIPGGWSGLTYRRLHGSPQIYRSRYDDGRLERLAPDLPRESEEDRPVWCMFDNTASGAATGDALRLSELLEGQGQAR